MADTLTQEQFAQAIIDRLPAAFASKNYVYGDITIEHMVSNPDAVSICIDIPGAEDDEMKITFPCGEQYAEYMRMCEHYKAKAQADTTADEVSDQFLNLMADSLTEAYNEEHLMYLKNLPTYEAINKSIEDPNWIMSHVYPELVQNDKLKNDAGNEYHLCISDNFDESLELSCLYTVVEDTQNIGARLRATLAVKDKLDMNALTTKAITNLNTKILNWLRMEKLIDHAMKTVLPEDTPQVVIQAVVNHNIEETPILGRSDIVVAGIVGAPLYASSILMSRTAMLAVAKRIKAKSKIRVIPINVNEIIMINMDDNIDELENEITDMVTKTIAQYSDQNHMTLEKPLVYDVITGNISY